MLDRLRHAARLTRAGLILVGALALAPLPSLAQPQPYGRPSVMAGTAHPAAARGVELDSVDSSQKLADIIVSMKGAPQNLQALQDTVDSLHNPASPDYQRWLTPTQIAERFGPPAADVQTVSQWLSSQGLQVQEVSTSRFALRVSGTVRQVEQAFGTQMRRYAYRGHQMVVNATDISLPTGLQGLTNGPVRLEFHEQPTQVIAQPQNITNGGGLALAPGDFAAIYNTKPLFANNLSGNGVSIAIIGRTRPSNLASNWNTFRSNFGLPASSLNVILGGTDPGNLGSNENDEANLDVQWSAGAAPGATINFVVASTIDAAATYAVNKNVAPVISVSFGGCEANFGSNYSQFWGQLWSQASLQGISVFVSSGDSGAAGCDAANKTNATGGLGVNGIGSSPYNVAVGGTALASMSSIYWSASNDSTQSNAKGYVPETAWNDSSSSNGLWSSGGGISRYWSKPTWQVAPGVSTTTTARTVPDVSLVGGGPIVYRVYSDSGWSLYSGTSASSPAMAGIMALIVQGQNGKGQGNPNPVFYRLANQQYTGGGISPFHDITSGNNSVPGQTGFSAGVGYDMVTGIGSVDAAQLLANWTAPTTCSYQLASSGANAAAGASSGNVNVTAGTGCAWTASSNASWITITSGSSGSGNGSVVYSLTSNTTSSARTGTLTIAGQTFTITQAPSPANCSFTFSYNGGALSSNVLNLAAGATSGNLTVNTGAGCNWSASTNLGWLTLPSVASGSGPGALLFNATANTGLKARSGSLTVAGTVFNVTQAAPAASCYYLLSIGGSAVTSKVLDFASNPASTVINITAPSGCPWTSTSPTSWISIASGASGTGSGTTWVQPSTNTSALARTGSVTVAGYTLTVNQGPSVANCTYSLGRSSDIIGAAATSLSLPVVATAGCNWAAVSSASWISITSSVTGTGSGTLQLAAKANTSASPRSGTVTVAGRIYNLIQRPANSFVSTFANDTFVGNTGVINTAIFQGAAAQYTITVNTNASVTVTDTVAQRDGSDTLVNFQRLQFADQSLGFDTASPGTAGGIYRLYAAAFNRTPDTPGLGYWIAQADAGLDPNIMAADFIASSEFQNLYGVIVNDPYASGLDVTALVTGFYNNVLHRAPDPGGLSFYVGQITSQTQTLAAVLAQLADSPENRTQAAAQISGGVAYVPFSN